MTDLLNSCKCGYSPEVQYNSWFGWYVACKGCGSATTDDYDLCEDAVKGWNNGCIMESEEGLNGN